MAMNSQPLLLLQLRGSNSHSPQVSRQTSTVGPPPQQNLETVVAHQVLALEEIKSEIKRVVPSLSGAHACMTLNR